MITIDDVKDIFKTKLNLVDVDDIKLTDTLDDLEIDSLDKVMIILEFEKRYGKSIPDDDAYKLNTIQDIIDYVNNHLS